MLCGFFSFSVVVVEGEGRVALSAIWCGEIIRLHLSDSDVCVLPLGLLYIPTDNKILLYLYMCACVIFVKFDKFYFFKIVAQKPQPVN